MTQILLDQRILIWVFFPIIYVTLVISLFKMYYSLYKAYSTTKKPVKKKNDYLQHKDKLLVSKCQTLAKKSSFITEQAFNSRRAFLCKPQQGYLQKIGQRQPDDAQNNMMKMQNNMMEGLAGSMVMMFTMMPTMAWISYFFAGFLLAKVPFSLTQKFRGMTQSGIDIQNLDVGYVSGLSFYFLILFGLGQINALFFKPDPEDQALLQKQPMNQIAPNPAQQNPMAMGMGMGMNQPQQNQQPKQIFKPQIESLMLVHHHFALKDCPKHALTRLKQVLGQN